MTDCKAPGACYSLCQECGKLHDIPSGAGSGLPPLYKDDGRMWMALYCSDACSAASTARAKAEGRIIELSDVTPERASELLGAIGLTLEGVGKVQLS